MLMICQPYIIEDDRSPNDGFDPFRVFLAAASAGLHCKITERKAAQPIYIEMWTMLSCGCVVIICEAECKVRLSLGCAECVHKQPRAQQ
eukprot:4922967-Pleurochrysis_carterae.AAC.2